MRIDNNIKRLSSLDSKIIILILLFICSQYSLMQDMEIKINTVTFFTFWEETDLENKLTPRFSFSTIYCLGVSSLARNIQAGIVILFLAIL